MPPTRKDAVHRYFTYDEVSNTSLCCLCNSKLKSKHSTNLKNHLSAKHKTEFQIVTGLNSELSSSQNTRNAEEPKIMEKIKKLCVRLVTVHGRPLAMMEDEAFQDLINLASRKPDGHTHINVKAIKNEITKEAFEIKNKISAEVKNSLVSLKLDAATCLERKFIGINIQYIKNAQIVVRNLAVLEVNERQTATFLKGSLINVLADFQISVEQIYCICTDNGSNMIKMVKLVGGEYCSQEEDNGVENEVEELIEEEDEENNENRTVDDIFISTDPAPTLIEILNSEQSSFRTRGMLCAAHTLQLAIKDANNEDSSTRMTISLAKKIVCILKRPNILNLIHQEKLKKPLNDCATRWTATYNMLVRLVELQDFCSTIPEISLIISDFFWSEVKMLIECYKPANDATLALQKQQLTLGDFFIIWLNCKNKIAAIQHDFAETLHRAMERREIKLLQNDVVLECLYLDGRLNIILSETQCQNARLLLNEVFQQMRQLNAQNVVSEESTGAIRLIRDEPTTSREVVASRDLAAIENILQNTERARGCLRRNRSFDACLYDVVTTPRLNLTENIISYWNNKSTTSSDIAQVANIVLAAPATQVSVERLFSSLKFILHPLRSNLSHYLLNDLMLIRSNKNLLN